MYCRGGKVRCILLLLLLALICIQSAAKKLKPSKESKHGDSKPEKVDEIMDIEPPPLADLSSSILVTGAAGFIGNHLAAHLHKIGFKTVVGLDTFNAYYSPALKRERAKNLLQETGVEVVDGDVCDAELLQSLFEQYKFTHIVHLAAQAGVRYSMVQPLTYIHANLKCFTILMEQIRSVGASGQPMPHFLYASSSSVYGLNKKIPFSESDPVTMPSNLYGATKRANELMAFSYHHLFGVSSIGFRFFTVYGPWGRPDMAAFIFSDLISQGKPITVYNQGKMKRDFTYVDDIVAGLTASLNYKHDKPVVFNLGNNKPIEAMYFLEVIEKELGMKAEVRFEDSKAEIPITYANVTLANRELGFRAKTTIEDGMHKFMSWYKAHESAKIACESGCQYGTMCHQSSWAEPMAKSQKLTKGCTTVVYTVALGVESLHHIDNFWPATGEGAKCSIAFITAGGTIDQQAQRGAVGAVSNWTVVPVSMAESDLRKSSRLPKLSPGKFFAYSVAYAIYVDNKIGLRKHPRDLVQLLNSDLPQKRAVVMMVRHPKADSLEAEVKELLSGSHAASRHQRGLDNGFNTLSEQWKAYQDYQLREKLDFNNMVDGSLVVHALKSEQGQEFRCKWYREFQDWAERDQVAAAFVIAKSMSDAKAPVATAPAQLVAVGRNKTDTSSGDTLRYARLLPARDYHWLYTNELAKFGRWE